MMPACLVSATRSNTKTAKVRGPRAVTGNGDGCQTTEMSARLATDDSAGLLWQDHVSARALRR